VHKTFCLIAVLFFAAALLGQTAQKKGPKVYISVDMEGIWGVVHGEQVSSTSGEYGVARRWMAEDVNAVVQGLYDAGAAEIVVNDSHGSMRNIHADALDPRVSLISGSPKPLSMMQGIDSSFDACIFVGYHARAGSSPAILDHTISGAAIRSIRINGREMPELGINAAIAGYFKVPVVMLSGDTETCAQAKAILGNELVTAPVKEAIGRVAARLYPAEEARRRLKEAAAEALAKRSRIPVFRLDPPYAFEVEFHNSAQAEPPSLLPQVKRTGPRAVSFGASDYIEGFKLLRAIIALAGTVS
jgi:D-amino peptidase